MILDQFFILNMIQIRRNFQVPEARPARKKTEFKGRFSFDRGVASTLIQKQLTPILNGLPSCWIKSQKVRTAGFNRFCLSQNAFCYGVSISATGSPLASKTPNIPPFRCKQTLRDFVKSRHISRYCRFTVYFVTDVGICYLFNYIAFFREYTYFIFIFKKTTCFLFHDYKIM